MKKIVFAVAAAVAACGGQTGPSSTDSANLSTTAVQVSAATAHDRSEPLRDIPSAQRIAAEAPNRPLRLIGAHNPGGVDVGL